MKKLLILGASLLMMTGLAGAWTVETVAILSDSCKGVGLAFDSENKPHIVYAEKHTDSVHVQEKYKDAGGAWQGPYDTNCPHCENMEAYGPWDCVAFDAKNDTFWIITLFGYNYNSRIYASYKYGIGGTWSPAVQVRSHYGTWPARFTACDVTIETGKVVHLVYADFNDMTIYYKKRTAGGWGADEQVGTPGDMYACWYYYSPSIALEGATPHIAGYFYNDDPVYYDVLPSYRNKSGGSWGTRIRMSNWAWWPNKGGGYVSLALNPMGNDYDWACWGDPENSRRVRYGQRVADGWTGTYPVTPGDMGSGNFCADMVGHANVVHLAYRDNSGDLKFASYEEMGPPTSTQTVDTEPMDVSYVCLKIAADGSVHIAYFANEAGSYKIKYAYSSSVGIEFSFLNAWVYCGSVKLLWRTESMSDISQWLIERAFGQPQYFDLIETIDGHGNKPGSTEYSFSDNGVSERGKYFYRIGAVNSQGETKWYGPVDVDFESVSGELLSVLPCGRGKVKISYTVENPTNAKIELFDLTGRKIVTLVNGRRARGSYSVTWDGMMNNGTRAPTGIYFIVLETTRQRIANRILLIP
jgi:hypothetical protein